MAEKPNLKPKNGSRLMTAHDVVKRFRLSYQTLNYYTTLGLLQVAKREGNERLYNARGVHKQLSHISRLKDEGYPLRLIARVLSDNGTSAPRPAVWVRS